MKYNNRKTKAPGAWTKTYPHAEFVVINRDNYLKFITSKD
jgi:hypothetical protein